MIRSWGFFDLLKVSMIRSWGCFDVLKVSMIRSWGFFDLLKVSMIWSCGLFDFPFPRKFFVIFESSRGSALYGFVEFFFRTICSLWLDRLEDLIFMVLLSYFPAQAICYDCTLWMIRYLGFRRVLYQTICSGLTVWSYLGGFWLILTEKYIYPGGLILLCTFAAL